jgi:transposase
MSPEAPPTHPVCPHDLPLPTLEQLPDDLPTLKGMVLELASTLRQERRAKEELRHRVELLVQRLYGKRTERFHPDQPLLFGDDVLEADQGQTTATNPQTPADEQRPKRKRRARPHGRRKLPEDLPRRPVHYQLTDAERLCVCGQFRSDIGVEVSEQLDWQPACYFVWQHLTHKYACPHCRGRGADNTMTTVNPAATEPTTNAGTQTPAAASATEPTASTNTTQAPATSAAEPTASTNAAQAPATSAAEPTASTNTTQAPATSAAEPIASTNATQTSATSAAQSAGPQLVPPANLLARPLGPAVISAAKPAMPIDKGLPGPGLLAHVIVSKYADHLPLYRQGGISKRQGVYIPRSTSCGWLAASAELLRPLYDLMVAAVLQSLWLHTDDTPVKNLGHEPGTTPTARFWLYYGDRTHPYNVFDFTLNRKRDGPQTFLANFHGYLHADAFSGYDGLYLPAAPAGTAPIIEVACNAHARRKFHEAKGSDLLGAHQALSYYGQLYELERAATAAGLDDDGRRRLRQELSVVILEKFHTWLKEQRQRALPKSPLGEAVGYALNNWVALCRFTEAGFLSIDNNVAEREMKRIAIGRKNWLFVGSEKGGHTAAVLFSFTSTCDRLGIDPWAYLQDVLTRLPRLAKENLAELLPDRWKAQRQHPSQPPVS